MIIYNESQNLSIRRLIELQDQLNFNYVIFYIKPHYILPVIVLTVLHIHC